MDHKRRSHSCEAMLAAQTSTEPISASRHSSTPAWKPRFGVPRSRAE